MLATSEAAVSNRGISPTRSIPQLLAEWGEDPDERRWDPLRRLANLTALKRAKDGTFHLGHWWRGPLLYAWVQRYQPRHVLEFGTGRGYGALCMAQAAEDAKLPCEIWTIDAIPVTATQQWPINEAGKPEIKQLSIQGVWSAHIDPAVRARVRCLTGDSIGIMASWKRQQRPPIDVCFIDGAHGYQMVRHDWSAALAVANPGCAVLFDDYTQRANYGVKHFVDDKLRRRLPKESIVTLWTGAQDYLAFEGRVEHGMALIRGEGFCIDQLRRHFPLSIARWRGRSAQWIARSRRGLSRIKGAYQEYAAQGVR